MASNSKPSVRSRASAPTVNGHHLETNVLQENLLLFKADKFDSDNYIKTRCSSMSEKEIRTLCSELVKLKKASAEEMRRSVYANYSAFIRTSREISDLERELLSIRTLLSSQASLVRNLVEDAHLDTLPNGVDVVAEDSIYDVSHHRMLLDGEKGIYTLPDTIDILIAERRIDEVLDAFLEGEKLVVSSSAKDATTAGWLQTCISERRAKLRDLLVSIAGQPSTRGSELREAISALHKLGDGPCAHTLLLSAHSQKLETNMQGLRTAYGGAYAASLSQVVFSTIAQAAKDSLSVFGKQASYASELVLWASNEAVSFASLVKRHVLSSVAAAGGLRAAAECVQVALGYCSQLEVQGLALRPILLKLFRPEIEQALQENLKQIEETISVLVSSEDWAVHNTSSGSWSLVRRRMSGGVSKDFKLSNSAHKFQMLIQGYLDDGAPLANLQLGGHMLEGLGRLFDSYIKLLMLAVPGPVDEGLGDEMGQISVRSAESEEQQLGLLANASSLAEEILPRAVAKLLEAQSIGNNEELSKKGLEKPMKEWKRRLHRMADQLRDYYCRQQVVHLIFPEDGESNFSFYSYLELDTNGVSLEPLPSQLFQQLFFKLCKLNHVAADVLAGRDRMIVVLLMKFVETFVVFISNDQFFWEEMENGEKCLGKMGLQQFLLDMQFVLQAASYGKYLNRLTRTVAGDIINRAIDAFSTTGIDPYDVLPENDWFVTAAQDSVRRLLEVSREDPGSPTASVSAQSLSSTRSHGSP